jgi:hypothetical protein
MTSEGLEQGWLTPNSWEKGEEEEEEKLCFIYNILVQTIKLTT